MSTPFTKIAAIISVGVALCLLSSCYEIRSDTILHPDGSIDRAVSQPRGHTPAEELESPVWNAARYDSETGFERLALPVAEHVEEGGEDENQDKKFVAWGRFNSFEDVPDHFVLKTADGTREARLTRRFRHNDYGFVQEYLWEETATEIVTVADMKEARREYAEVWRRLIYAFCEEYFGDDYDCTGIDKWLRNEGDEWHEAFVDLEFDNKARQSRRVLALDFGDDEAHDLAFLALCKRYGLDLAGGDGAIAQSEFFEDALRAFLRETLLNTLRTRDGDEVDPAVLEGLLDGLSGDGIEVAADDEGEAEPSATDLAWERATQRVFDSESLTEDDQKSMEQRLNGIQSGTFQFTMTVPGVIVESSGTLLEDNQVRWDFGGAEAFPYGFPMAVRSIAADEDLQRRILSAALLNGREPLLQFAKLAAEDMQLATALRECVEKGSVAPLTALRETIAKDQDEESRQARSIALTKVEALLGLPRR
ncbi:MAG: hypothetical protein ACI8UO_006353 [Verrucomicrobiales bacterium]|jgi:hypothetical protein